MFSESISVIDKSGKVVSSSKHLVSVLKEAKAAYLSRRAEIKAVKERDVRRTLQNLSLNDTPQSPRGHRAPTNVGSRGHGAPPPLNRAHTTHHNNHGRRSYDQQAIAPPLERGYTDTAYANANDNVYAPTSRRSPHGDMAPRQLVRRSTEPPRPSSADSYDEHLAYGEIPPPIQFHSEEEIHAKMTAVNRMLMEADCLKYTANTMIEQLQRNPDRMAAVGMALADISSLVAKAAPGALTGLKASFPAVMALLASPEFLIAGGLAVGVTVIMFGGYKIIKKIKEANRSFTEDDDDVSQIRELESELSRVDIWRRGVAEASAGASAVSVEGELITPGAHRRAVEEGRLLAHQVKPLQRSNSERAHRRRKSSPHSVASYHRQSGRRSGSGSQADEREFDAKTAVTRRTKTYAYDGESHAGSHRSHGTRKSSNTSSGKKSHERKKSVGGIKGLLFGGKKRKTSNAV